MPASVDKRDEHQREARPTTATPPTRKPWNLQAWGQKGPFNSDQQISVG